MLVAEATVRTPRASRFLVQLCRHAEAMGGRAQHLHGGDHERPEVVRVEWTDDAGLIEFTWGRCTLRSTADELVVELDVDGADRLRVIRDLLTADLERFGQRDGLKVSWQGVEVVVAVLARRRVRAHHIPGFAAHADGHLRRSGGSAARQRAGHDGDRDEHSVTGKRRQRGHGGSREAAGQHAA